MFPRFGHAQRGITLIEVILWTAIVAAAAVAAFVFSQKVSVNAAVESEQRQIEDIVKTVDGLFATRSDFADLGTNGAIYLKDHAARTGLKMGTNSSGDPVLLTDIGSSKVVELRAELIPNPATPSVANGYSLRYQGLASDQCTRLVTAVAPITHGIRVGPRGRGPADPSSGVYVVERGNLSKTPDEVAQACANQEEVSLFFLPSRAVAATAVTAPPPLARCNPVHEVQQTACPAGQLGSITQERDGTCTGPNNTMVYTAWTTTDNTCQDPPVAPPTVTPPSTPDNCTTITTDRIQSCPAGQIGQVVQRRTENTCDGTTSPWSTVSSSCLPPPTTGTCSPSTQNRTQPCPASAPGGQIVQSRSSTCASPTATPVWGAWNTVSNTCTNSCSQGGNSCCTVRRETQPGPECPAGTWGASGEQERFLGCANAQTQSSTWTPWQDMTSGACTACPATTNETQTHWVDRTSPCPPGETGEITFEAEQVRLQEVSYNCPAGTTALPAPTYGGWGGWTDTGAVRNVVNTCAPTTVETCSDGSPLVSAWFSLDNSDPRIQRAYYTWQAPTFNWVPETIVTPTDAEAQRIQAAVSTTPINRTEYPAPYTGFPPNWNENAGYGESCGAAHNAGNIRAGYDQSFECVDHYGMHYCDYSFYSGSTAFSVCRHACLADLVGKRNYPFRWTHTVVPISQSSNPCTGQPGCVANTYSITPPLCGPENVGATIENVRWYHGYGTGGGAAWRNVTLTCGGPDLDPGNASCTVPAGQAFEWDVEDPARSNNYSEMVTCQGVNPTTQTIAHGESIVINDGSGAETGVASFRCLNGTLARVQDGDAICAVTNPNPCVAGAGGRLFSWKTSGRFCQAWVPGGTTVASGSTITVTDNNSSNTNVGLSPRQGQATFACYNGFYTGIPTNHSCN